jgi:hypothetical protein
MHGAFNRWVGRRRDWWWSVGVGEQRVSVVEQDRLVVVDHVPRPYALGHIARDRFGKAIGLIVIALIPGLFLFDPTGASKLIQTTVNGLTGG